MSHLKFIKTLNITLFKQPESRHYGCWTGGSPSTASLPPPPSPPPIASLPPSPPPPPPATLPPLPPASSTPSKETPLLPSPSFGPGSSL
ncbi:hypothetical protein Hanom_Chr01g00009321 [Helianthus anomalus]